MTVSCGSTGGTANGYETTAAPEPQSSPAQAAGPEGTDVVLLDLDDAGEVAGWTTVTDPVMGGLSTSAVSFRDGGLVFSGSISLENNGGFTSARSPQDPSVISQVSVYILDKQQGPFDIAISGIDAAV
ncbi:MAG: CIA30 family protein [Actinomycetia bacterium]|nr:CIA30 family protein [Actinomycetes bacterium]